MSELESPKAALGRKMHEATRLILGCRLQEGGDVAQEGGHIGWQDGRVELPEHHNTVLSALDAGHGAMGLFSLFSFGPALL